VVSGRLLYNEAKVTEGAQGRVMNFACAFGAPDAPPALALKGFRQRRPLQLKTRLPS
jgi:hypothetical protein